MVVCGGGPTGVEMAGGLVELYDKVLAKDFPQLDVAGALITLVEAGPRLLGTFTEPSGRRAMRTFERRGVQVITGVGVDRVASDAVHLVDGRRIAAQTVVWAAGVRASLWPSCWTCRCRAAGGSWSSPICPSELVPRSSRSATSPATRTLRFRKSHSRQSKAAGTSPNRSPTDWRVGRPRAFRYKDKGSMATIGRLDAVAEFPNGMRLSGPVGWVAWLGLHIVYLMGFRNSPTCWSVGHGTT